MNVASPKYNEEWGKALNHSTGRSDSLCHDSLGGLTSQEQSKNHPLRSSHCGSAFADHFRASAPPGHPGKI